MIMMKQSSVLLENRNTVLLETGITGILEQLEYWTNWNTGILEQSYCSSYSGFASSFCPSALARLSCSKTSITFVSAMAVIS